MSSKRGCDLLNLARDLPTSAEDVLVLARLRAASPSWLSLDQSPIDDVQAARALAARPTARAEWPPFSLPPG